MGLVLVTREGCGLCEKAERALWTLGVPYVRRDVDREPKLAPYALRVPVLRRRPGRSFWRGLSARRSSLRL